MTRKEKETVLKAVENAYFKAYKNDKNPLMWARASALRSLAEDLGIDMMLVFHMKNLAKVAALGIEEKTA